MVEQQEVTQNPPKAPETPQAKPPVPAGQAPQTPGSDDANKKSRSHLLLWFSIGLIIVALIWFCYWFFYLRFFEYTDDAYANGNIININSAISGSVVAFYADDTDLVEEGQLLVKLDDTAYLVSYELELATLGSIVLQVRQLFDQVEVNMANAEAKHIAYQKSSYDYENRKRLVSSLAISNEDFIHAEDDYKAAKFNMEQAEAQLKASLSAVGNTDLNNHPLIEQQKNKVLEAFYKLRHCAIFSPAKGYVAQRAVQVGEWVSPSTNLMAVIPIDYVWVDANYKETELTYMRIGQPAKVWLDIYGSEVMYTGKVLGIASGTGSVFSIIPPQNATGNWIKIVQRLPVRISLDPNDLKRFPTRLGLSAEVCVDVTDRSLPMLATVPSKKLVGATTVFDLDFVEVNKAIEEVIRNNLNKKS